ncbi:MAG: DNA-directed RNA polymerase subunit P [Candidatus Diapherotrites archaeon]|nr:DNA-directed RNA polymerase subunit P [Candidatus Diapherotrites archaeon]
MSYKCIACGEVIDSLPFGAVRCPSCASKVLSKLRDPIAKTIKAE